MLRIEKHRYRLYTRRAYVIFLYMIGAGALSVAPCRP